MKNVNNGRRWLTLGVSAVLGAGLMVAAAPSASAQSYYYDGRYYTRTTDRDRDGIPNWRDPHPSRYDGFRVRGYRGTYRGSVYDIDRDGVPNWRDRDRDGDGVRDRRDRDRDGDGIRNQRDRHPNNPRRR
jgi:hypothetical protein